MISITVSGTAEVRKRMFCKHRVFHSGYSENSMREDDMRARLVLQMMGDDGETIATETIADLVKVTQSAEDLGLSLSEAKTLLAKLQQAMVETQVESWLKENCNLDGRRLRSKGSYRVTFHTLFGDVRLKSPRYWGRNKSSAKSYAKVERSGNVMRHAVAQLGGGAT